MYRSRSDGSAAMAEIVLDEVDKVYPGGSRGSTT
jgi:hypothetical protein